MSPINDLLNDNVTPRNKSVPPEKESHWFFNDFTALLIGLPIGFLLGGFLAGC